MRYCFIILFSRHDIECLKLSQLFDVHNVVNSLKYITCCFTCNHPVSCEFKARTFLVLGSQNRVRSASILKLNSVSSHFNLKVGPVILKQEVEVCTNVGFVNALGTQQY